jgi:hypothetical protein
MKTFNKARLLFRTEGRALKSEFAANTNTKRNTE